MTEEQRLAKNKRISQTKQDTLERHKDMICKCYTCKIHEKSLSKKNKELLDRMFLEAKWLKNYMLAWSGWKSEDEEYKKLLADVEELQKDKAEATVDSFIHKGVILPAQRETAIKLCLNDNDTFLDLYRDAKPIVDTTPQRKSVPSGTAERIANYFKN